MSPTSLQQYTANGSVNKLLTLINVLDDVNITKDTASSSDNSYLTCTLLLLIIITAIFLIAAIYYGSMSILYDSRAKEVELNEIKIDIAEELYFEAQHGYA